MKTSAVAVLTGDLIASTRLTALEVDAAMQAIEKATIEMAAWQAPPKATRFTRFRGDGWQMVLHRPSLALRAAVVIQGRLTALEMKSRISIGIGQAESLGTDSLADAAGRAFELSGKGLDKMGNAWRLSIDKDEIRIEDQLIADLLGERMDKWTAAQAQAASLHLASPLKARTLFDIGTELNISPQAVNDRVRGAGCHTIASVLRRWERQKVDQGWETLDA
jgi:hypothetical protein